MSDNGSDIPDDPAATYQQRVSTRSQLQNLPSLKNGYLDMKLEMKFHLTKWKRYFFKLRGKKLFYANSPEADIFYEIDLSDVIIAESGNKNKSCSFEVHNQQQVYELSGSSRKDMDEWITAIKKVSSKEYYESDPRRNFHHDVQGNHSWYVTNHARPTFCNVCHNALGSVMNNGLSCEVCKFKAHKHCASKAPSNCKWATLLNASTNITEDESGIHLHHQWMDGNLPVNKKCEYCHRSCGSVLRFQDSRCLWCGIFVHSDCKDRVDKICNLGRHATSILPPTALSSINDEQYHQAIFCNQVQNPLLVFINSKSGDNKGVLFLRRFRRYLNPAQVFDLMCNGPTAGLKLFAKLDKFRVLVAGGDGSVGWVLTEMDKLNLHHKAVVGVLPLGTGNDLSQVLGWGTVCSNDSNVPQIINYVERATTKMLDRWSVLTYDGPPIVSGSDMPTNDEAELNNYLDTILDNQNPEKVHKAVDGLYELSKKVQTSRLSKFLDLIQKAGWTNNADVNQQTRNQVIDRANSIKKLLRAAVQSENSPRKSPIASPKPRISPNLTDSSGNSGSGATSKISPFRYVTEDLYDEKYVMNNYFGIGVDAKIVLEFHKKRDASPKSASRLKNMMRFGLLSGAEMLSQTYKDLHKRIEVECDGEVVRLPALQGIVIMNIPSYSGGMNFWGNTDNHETFVTPSFNDKMFEVMAVFGTTHLALSMAEKATRVNAISSHAMQCHRIAQCSSVRVTILEGDPLPIQVDGEAWLQRPGVIQIKHKNRVHMLAKAKQGNPARDEVIDLTDEEIELLSKQFLLLHSFCSRPKEKSSKQIDDLVISLQDYEKHKLDPNIVLTRSNFFAVFQHVELVRQNTLTEDNEIIFRIDQVLAEIAKEMPWSLNQPQNQKPTNPKVSKTTIKQQISKLNERLEKLGLPGDVSLWTNQNVSTWLKEVVRVEHETLKIFIDHDIKGKDVLGLDRHDLRRTMQIREDDKKKFMAERELLRKLQKDRKS